MNIYENLISLLLGLLFQYISLRPYLRVRPRTAVILNTLLLLLCVAVVRIFPAIQSNKFVSSSFIFWIIFFLPLALYLFKAHRLQYLFVIAYLMCLYVLVMGTGTWLTFLFADTFLAETGVSTTALVQWILFLILLPPAIYLFKKLLAAWGSNSDAVIWKVMWIVPMALFALTMLSGNIYTLTKENCLLFIVTRVLAAVALIAYIYLISGITNQEKIIVGHLAQTEMLDTLSRAQDSSQAKAMMEWAKITEEKAEAVMLMQQILANLKSGDYVKNAALLHDRIDGMNTAAAITYCENTAVNALANHYAGIALNERIEISFQLVIPANTGQISLVDLSRIVGNMLENAVEACQRMEYGNRYICLKSMLRGSSLILVMDNSFDGDLNITQDHKFISRKRKSGIATGLSSIQSVTNKYQGRALFEADGRVFKTSIRLEMERA